MVILGGESTARIQAGSGVMAGQEPFEKKKKKKKGLECTWRVQPAEDPYRGWDNRIAQHQGAFCDLALFVSLAASFTTSLFYPPL